MTETQPPAPDPKPKSKSKASFKKKIESCNLFTVQVMNGNVDINVHLGDKSPEAIEMLVDTLHYLGKGKLNPVVALKVKEAGRRDGVEVAPLMADYLSRSGPKIKPSEATERMLGNFDE